MVNNPPFKRRKVCSVCKNKSLASHNKSGICNGCYIKIERKKTYLKQKNSKQKEGGKKIQ